MSLMKWASQKSKLKGYERYYVKTKNSEGETVMKAKYRKVTYRGLQRKVLLITWLSWYSQTELPQKY